MKPPTPEEIKKFRTLRKWSRAKFAELCGVDYATVANWELDRNKPKGPTLQRVIDVMQGRVTATNLSAAEEALLERIMKEGGYKTREEFFGQALVALVAKGSLAIALAFLAFHHLQPRHQWTGKSMMASAKAASAMLAKAL